MRHQLCSVWHMNHSSRSAADTHVPICHHERRFPSVSWHGDDVLSQNIHQQGSARGCCIPPGLSPPNSPSRLQAAIAPCGMPRAGCHQRPGACGAAAAVKEGLRSLIFSLQTTSCWSRGIWQSSANLSPVPGREGKSVAGSPLWNTHTGTQEGEVPPKPSSQSGRCVIPLQEHQEAPAEPEQGSVPRRPRSVSGLSFVCAEWSTHTHTGTWLEGTSVHPFTGVPRCRALVGTTSRRPSPPRPALHTPE